MNDKQNKKPRSWFSKPETLVVLLALVLTASFTAQPKALDTQTTQVDFGSMFTLSPSQEYGSAACENQTPSGGTNAPCNPNLVSHRNKNWQNWFSYNDTSMNLNAGNDCRTINTGSNNACVFTVGDNGITEITFDFDISGACHTSDCVDWLAFWIYSNPWENSTEADFVESLHGPASSGLNMNFAGRPTQQYIYSENPDTNWSSSVTATFSGSGSNVNVQMTSTARPGVIANGTLTRDTGYFFVFNTNPTTESGCSITISNVSAKGSIDTSSNANNCNGLLLNN